jgi:hypothetical protein
MNSLNVDLHGKIVVVKQQVLTGTTSNPYTRMFRCNDGNGLSPSRAGNSIFGNLVGHPSVKADEVFTINAEQDIERMAEKEEVARLQ